MYFFIYEIIILFLIPFALAKLVYRGLNKSKQLKYLSERFAIIQKIKGFYGNLDKQFGFIVFLLARLKLFSILLRFY